MINIDYYNTPLGELILGSWGEKLCLCDWKFRSIRGTIDSRIQKALKTQYIHEKSEIIEETKRQLEQYFKGKRRDFSIPVLLIGTEFQKTVWKVLMGIPYGTTKSYSQLSNEIGAGKSFRAVASANGANAISILVPCHRVIGNRGNLTGYAGGLNAKKQLLKLEKALQHDQLELF